jgi:DNA-binding response OmpR family regulator
MRILLVEDEKKIATLIRQALKEQRFDVEATEDGNSGLEMASRQKFDAVILDIMLPGRDGLSMLRELRRSGNTVPVLILSARSERIERVNALNLGADDYLTKPFGMDELIARMNALGRRASSEKLTVLTVGDLVMNLVTRNVTRGGKKVELTIREFALLEYLMRSAGRAVSRTNITELVWDYHFDTGTNLVDVYIQRLRRKIDDGHAEKLIQTERGIGYKIGG